MGQQTPREDWGDTENAGVLVCPKDGSTLLTMSVEDTEIDRCPTCGGIWFDLGELRRLLGGDGLEKEDLLKKDKAQAHVDVHTRTAPRCPRDGFAMMTIRDSQQRHVAYELCMMCGGIFLDSGELRDLSKFTLVEKLRAAVGR
jgi:Zn-finger nucleic acid-binding protein